MPASPTISSVHDDEFYASLAGVLAASPDVARLYIKDPTGLLTPERARTLIPAVRARIGAKALELHSHCTIGLAPLTYMTAAELGIDVLHIACGPLANGTSLPDARRVVANLRELGHTVDVHDASLQRVASYFSSLADAEALPAGAPQEYDAAFLRHQLPGGAITTTIRQLEELNLSDRLPAVIEETIRVRAELGYPIMVTPFPQIVCTQALFNVIGSERYANVPDQVIRYVIGRFGRPTAPVDANVKDRILARPRARELAAEPPPPTLGELRRRFGKAMKDEEFLLRAVMPAEQVDAMLAAQPTAPRYNPDTRPIVELIREMSRRRIPLSSSSRNRTSGSSCVVEPDQWMPPMTYTHACAPRGRFSLISMAHWCSATAAITRSNPFPAQSSCWSDYSADRCRMRSSPTAPYARPRNTFMNCAMRGSRLPITSHSRRAAWLLILHPDRLPTRARARRRGSMATTGSRWTRDRARISREPVDAVFVGWYREFTMDEIEAACDAITGGARLYTGSLAPHFASAQGKVLSSSRVLCAAITSITGKRATVLGKPAAEAVRCACRHLGTEPTDLVVVGDDPALEVFMARRVGALGIAVRTGVWASGESCACRPHTARIWRCRTSQTPQRSRCNSRT